VKPPVALSYVNTYPFTPAFVTSRSTSSIVLSVIPAPLSVVFPAEVNLPSASTVNVETPLVEPYVPADTLVHLHPQHLFVSADRYMDPTRLRKTLLRLSDHQMPVGPMLKAGSRHYLCLKVHLFFRPKDLSRL